MTFDIPKTSATHTLLYDQKAGTEMSMSLRNYATGTPSAAYEILMKAAACYLMQPAFTYEGEYEAIRLQAKVVRPSAGWSGNELIQYADAIDWGF